MRGPHAEIPGRSSRRRAAARPPVVTVSAPARLHLGLLDLDGGLGRRFGGLGAAIDAPRTEVSVSAEGRDDVTDVAPDLAAGLGAHEAEAAAARLAEIVVWHRLAGLPAPRAARVRLLAAPAAHAGFGSGTSLALAVGTALAHAAGYALAPSVLARTLKPGLRSGIGIAVFESGGLAVDGGRPHPDVDGPPEFAPSVLARYAVPDAWRFVVVVPERERTAPAAPRPAERPRPARAERVAEVCRRLLMEVLPALVEGDLRGFGRGLMLAQRLAADESGPGRWPGSRAAAIVAALVDAGAAAAGQSAFGPACYGLVATEDDAARVAGALREVLAAQGSDAALFVAAPDNQGARVTVTPRSGRAPRRP